MYLVLSYGFCTKRDVTIFLSEIFEEIPNKLIGIFMFMKLNTHICVSISVV